MKDKFEILLVVPLEEELAEVLEVFPPTDNRSTETGFRYVVETGQPDVRMLVVQQVDMGRLAATRAIEDAFVDYDFDLVVCIGIAGSLSGDLRLGDVCYSGTIMDVYDNAKAEDVEGKLEFALSPSFYKTPERLTAAANFIRTFPELKELKRKWEDECAALASEILPEPVIERDGSKKKLEKPKSKHGLIACGVVTKSTAYNKKILAADRRVLAIETESGGIFEEAKRRSVPAMTFRGISDHADGNKSRLEAETGAAVRKIAASNAARFFRAQLQNAHFRRALASASNGVSVVTGTSETIVSPVSLVESVTHFIDERLRELSPDFRLRAKGYRLPVPRIREVRPVTSMAQTFEADPFEVRDALAVKNCMLLNLAKTYPDRSLPWVIASDLIVAEVGGKQLLPVVISGERIRPPQPGLVDASEYPFKVPEDIAGTQLVYIIDEIPLGSPTRIRFLEDEIRNRPDAKFIIISRNDAHLLTSSEFAGAIGATFWQLSDISFGEIAHFIQKNFEITATESEVIALRLRDTFRHFDLSAHPTYFAGISLELLNTLLQANRRAELIQLAADGFLSLVVASDKSTVVLSRTTREKFLRTLAREIKVERKQLSEEDVIQRIKSIITEMGFEIDPLRFLASFVDSGILHFHNGALRFSLPFFESYLLAQELRIDALSARTYFSLANDDIDLGTFDLYAELGPSADVVEHVLTTIDQAISRFSLGEEEHVLLTSAVRPQSIKDLDRLETLEKGLKKTAEDVTKGKGDVRQKQKILDVADRAREAAVDRSGFGLTEEKEELSEEDKAVRQAVMAWAVGTTLLGAGAEELTATTKQRLASYLIQLGSIIIHRWTSANSQVDFKEIKKDLTTDETLAELVRNGPGSDDRREVRRQVENLVDVLEFGFIAEPLARMLGHLCEAARLKVLAVSVEQAEANALFEQLFNAIWLIDIDPDRGRKRLLEVVKRLPAAPFLRIILATHFLMRVYWNHWKKEDRLILLEAAEETLRPISSLNKGELIRLIEGGKNKKS